MTTHTFVGNLTADPEFRPASDGRASVHLRIACSERYYSIKAREWRSKDPTFWDAYAWGDRAEAVAAAGFRKGNPVVLVGELVANSWMDESGQTRHRTTVAIEAVGHNVAIPRRKSATALATPTPPEWSEAQDTQPDGEDLQGVIDAAAEAGL